MKMWLVMVYSFLSYTCDGSSVNQSTHSSVNTAYTGTDITDIKMEVDVMKGNYHDLLLRVINNEHEIVTLKGQTQQMVNELENTKRTFSCEIEDLRATTIQYEQEINETKNSWNTLNETIQDLSQSVSVLKNKLSILESLDTNSNEHDDGKSNEPGLASEKQECPLEWIRNVDFGACYFFSSKPRSWDGAQEQCREQNGSLADIHSEDEALWMADAARNNGGVN
ncbi:oxidized low-density lipoprotein receptor 1-like [Mytilus trossulus]|uniref:oxidized low-density lipoprotein receptor 1-like n=1 Tax=Mytilus trossulus TaxID=6551 RepID=UPI003004C639